MSMNQPAVVCVFIGRSLLDLQPVAASRAGELVRQVEILLREQERPRLTVLDSETDLP